MAKGAGWAVGILALAVLGIIITTSLGPREERVMYRHFAHLEKAGRERVGSYGGGM
jgi:hypothetical protein